MNRIHSATSMIVFAQLCWIALAKSEVNLTGWSDCCSFEIWSQNNLTHWPPVSDCSFEIWSQNNLTHQQPPLQYCTLTVRALGTCSALGSISMRRNSKHSLHLMLASYSHRKKQNLTSISLINQKNTTMRVSRV